MNILITERPSENGYIESLINAYSQCGNTVTCDASNFFYSSGIPDVLHIHWPESLYKWSRPAGIKESDTLKVIEERLVWFKSKGTKILNTIHNLQPHDSTHEMDRQAYRLIIKHADILIHHCERSVALLSEAIPAASEKINIVCPHGDYLIHYKALDQRKARNTYGLPEDSVIILNFGRQRPYKNGNFILSAFRKLDLDTKYLVIAGIYDYPDNGRVSNFIARVRNKIRKTRKYSDRKFLYKHFSVLELPVIISCADIIFLGQKHALNSGLLPLAATFGKPVVCPDTGCFREAVSGWDHEMYDPGNVTDASNALQRMSETVLKAKKESGRFDNSAWLEENSWGKHVRIILSHLQ